MLFTGSLNSWDDWTPDSHTQSQLSVKPLLLLQYSPSRSDRKAWSHQFTKQKPPFFSSQVEAFQDKRRFRMEKTRDNLFGSLQSAKWGLYLTSFLFHKTDQQSASMNERGTKKRKNNSSEIIVRHSGVSRWSGQIRQADVQSHVRSHVRDSMDSFRKLWSHHPTILPSTPCDGKSCFIPHGIPKGHLQQTYTHHVYTQTQNITDIVTFAQGSIHKQESNMSASSESLHSWMLKKIYNVHNLRMQMRTKYDIYGNTIQDARDHVKVSAWSLQALVLKCVTWTEVLTSMAINSHTWKWFQKARKLKRTKTVYASKKENMSLSLNHKSPVHTILWPTSSFTNTEGWNGWSQKTCIWGEFMKTSFPTP